MFFPETREPAAPARFTIAVGSGKGGVGKSTVSLNLALALAETGSPVGVLDADFAGPNIPLMVGLKREKWTIDWTLAHRREQPLIPPTERYGLKIMSAGFIIAEDQPLVLDAQTTSFLSRQLVRQVDWGDLEYLIVDLPPGTGDTQQILLRQLAFTGAILIVTPQDVAHLDGKKAIGLFERAKVPLLGAVENMSGYLCPHCGKSVDVFSRVPEERSVWTLGVPRLGAIPLDPTISQAGDQGTPLLVKHPRSRQADAFRAVARAVREKLEMWR
jgi:ATP-binding protein involved in chromosome partitioning